MRAFIFLLPFVRRTAMVHCNMTNLSHLPARRPNHGTIREVGEVDQGDHDGPVRYDPTLALFRVDLKRRLPTVVLFPVVGVVMARRDQGDGPQFGDGDLGI